MNGVVETGKELVAVFCNVEVFVGCGIWRSEDVEMRWLFGIIFWISHLEKYGRRILIFFTWNV